MHRVRHLLLLGWSLLLLLAGSTPVGAQGQFNQPFTVPANGTVTVQFEAFCIDLGKPFPIEGVKAPAELAPARVRAALAYVQQQNLTANQASQDAAQFAIWRLRNAPNAPQGNDQTTTVINNAVIVPANPAGTSILDAAKDGRLTLEVRNWQPKNGKIDTGRGVDYSVGQGTLVLRNTTAQALDVYVPVGVQFSPTAANGQNMAGYATATDARAAQVSQQSGQLPASSGFSGELSLLMLAAGVGILWYWMRLLRRELGVR